MFHFFIEHIHGRFRRHNEIADDCADGDEQPAARDFCERFAHLCADGHETDVGAREKQREPDERVYKPYAHFDCLTLRKGAREQLEQQEKRRDGRERQPYFL